MDRPRAPLISRPWAAALLAPTVAFLVVFFAWPVANIVGEGLRSDGGWDLSGIGDVVGDPALRQVAWFTLWQAAASTALTVLLALPAAHVLARFEFRGRRAVQALVVVPFVLPTVVVGAAFLALLGPTSPVGLDLRGSAWAILLAHAFFNHAIVVRTVGGLWEGLDPRTEEAARILGASRWRAFQAVTLPALRPAIASAAAITFLFTFTSFGVVRILGGAGRSTLEVEIYRQTADLLDLPVASVLALLQLGAVGTMLVVQDRLERRRAVAAVAMRPADRRRARERGERWWLAGNLVAMALLLGVPLATLVDRSFRAGDGGHGLGAWRALGEATSGTGLFVTPLEAVANSLRFAALATIVAVTLGGLAAAALARSRGRVARVLDGVLLLPLGTSAVTVGFGFLIALDEPVDLRASPQLVPLAQAVVALPFVVRTMTPVLRSIDPRLHEAAAVLGASPARTWRAIDLPLARRAVLVAAGFAFAISLGEFGATTVIARADTPTVPIAIARLLGRPGPLNTGQAFALSTVLMVLTAVAVLLVDRWRPRGRQPWRLGVTPRLEVASATVQFGELAALDAVDLTVAAGEVVVILGASGSGKSTLLRAVAGLQPLDAGHVALDGADVTGVPPHRRGVGLMFQDHALFPHLDVGANVAFGLRMQRRDDVATERRVAELLDLVGLPGTERRAIHTLSGGEQQRVALARSLAPEPAVLLLDEPLGALDRPLRERLVVELRQLFAQLRLTVVAVTHDQTEAFALADRLVVVDHGRVLQSGTPAAVWGNPVSGLVARLLGFTNVAPVTVAAGRLLSPWGDVGPGPPDAAAVLLRPDGIRMDPTGPIEGTVVASTFAGAHARVRVSVAGAPDLDADVPGDAAPPVGAQVHLRVDPAAVQALPA